MEVEYQEANPVPLSLLANRANAVVQYCTAMPQPLTLTCHGGAGFQSLPPGYSFPAQLRCPLYKLQCG